MPRETGRLLFACNIHTTELCSVKEAHTIALQWQSWNLLYTKYQRQIDAFYITVTSHCEPPSSCVTLRIILVLYLHAKIFFSFTGSVNI